MTGESESEKHLSTWEERRKHHLEELDAYVEDMKRYGFSQGEIRVITFIAVIQHIPFNYVANVIENIAFNYGPQLGLECIRDENRDS